jgi:hypothetical protein
MPENGKKMVQSLAGALYQAEYCAPTLELLIKGASRLAIEGGTCTQEDISNAIRALETKHSLSRETPVQ